MAKTSECPFVEKCQEMLENIDPDEELGEKIRNEIDLEELVSETFAENSELKETIRETITKSILENIKDETIDLDPDEDIPGYIREELDCEELIKELLEKKEIKEIIIDKIKTFIDDYELEDEDQDAIIGNIDFGKFLKKLLASERGSEIEKQLEKTLISFFENYELDENNTDSIWENFSFGDFFQKMMQSDESGKKIKDELEKDIVSYLENDFELTDDNKDAINEAIDISSEIKEILTRNKEFRLDLTNKITSLIDDQIEEIEPDEFDLKEKIFEHFSLKETVEEKLKDYSMQKRIKDSIDSWLVQNLDRILESHEYTRAMEEQVIEAVTKAVTEKIEIRVITKY